MTLLKSHYLDAMGIKQWVGQTPSVPFCLIPIGFQQDSVWLFILEKEEAVGDLSLLMAILGAVGESLETVTLAYYDEGERNLLALPALKFVVAMGQAAKTQFLLHRRQFSDDIIFINSGNLTLLSQDPEAKRALWQQLKPYRK